MEMRIEKAVNREEDGDTKNNNNNKDSYKSACLNGTLSSRD